MVRRHSDVIGLNRTPSIGLKRTPSNGLIRTPSNGLNKAPSNGLNKAPSNELNKAPSNGLIRTPSIDKSVTFKTKDGEHDEGQNKVKLKPKQKRRLSLGDNNTYIHKSSDFARKNTISESEEYTNGDSPGRPDSRPKGRPDSSLSTATELSYMEDEDFEDMIVERMEQMDLEKETREEWKQDFRARRSDLLGRLSNIGALKNRRSSLL